MREISRGEGPKIKHSERSGQKKRKYSSDKQSIQNAAQAFLEKAARELLGDNKDGFKGPLQVNSSDEDDKPDNWFSVYYGRVLFYVLINYCFCPWVCWFLVSSMLFCLLMSWRVLKTFYLLDAQSLVLGSWSHLVQSFLFVCKS